MPKNNNKNSKATAQGEPAPPPPPPPPPANGVRWAQKGSGGTTASQSDAVKESGHDVVAWLAAKTSASNTNNNNNNNNNEATTATSRGAIHYFQTSNQKKSHQPAVKQQKKAHPATTTAAADEGTAEGESKQQQKKPEQSTKKSNNNNNNNSSGTAAGVPAPRSKAHAAAAPATEVVAAKTTPVTVSSVSELAKLLGSSSSIKKPTTGDVPNAADPNVPSSRSNKKDATESVFQVSQIQAQIRSSKLRQSQQQQQQQPSSSAAPPPPPPPPRRQQQQSSKQQVPSAQPQQQPPPQSSEMDPAFQSTYNKQVQFMQQYQCQETVTVDHAFYSEFSQKKLNLAVILELIAQHDVVFVCTDTGSGKSTLVPQALLEADASFRIASTQPRRTATINLANRVASQRRESVGEDVGYWIRGDKRGDASTRLWYMTSYTLLLHILNHPMDTPFTHIILDEFHERQPDVEVIVALLKTALRHRRTTCKVIIMSATLSTEDWEGFFGEGVSVATYKQPEEPHVIQDYFVEDISTLLGLQYTPNPALTPEHVDHMQLDQSTFLTQQLLMLLNSATNPQHSILVFLPGRAQVESFAMWLAMQAGNRLDIVPWHSAVDLSVIEAAIKRRHPHKQKVYLATDIAEVSITLPDVVFVIDFALVKRPKIDLQQPASVMYPPLVLNYVSRSSIAQRRGRAGRVQRGFYFCLLPSTFVSQLKLYAPPPIEHARIDELSLHTLQIVSNPAALFSLCHGQPTLESMSCAMSTLVDLGCIIPASDPCAAAERVVDTVFEPMNEADGETNAEENTSSSRSSSSSSSSSSDDDDDDEEEILIGKESSSSPSSAAAAQQQQQKQQRQTKRTRQEWNKYVMREAATVLAQEGIAAIPQYEYTFVGRLLQLVPVSPQQGMLIFYGLLTGLESLSILAAAVTSSSSPFTVGDQQQLLAKAANNNNRRGNQQQQRRGGGGGFESLSKQMEATEASMKAKCHGLRSDIIAVIEAVLLFKEQCLALGIPLSALSSASSGAAASASGSDESGLLLRSAAFQNERTALAKWCAKEHLSLERLEAILDLESHIKAELTHFTPFRDVQDPKWLRPQLAKTAPLLMIMINVAFAVHALEVVSEGSTLCATKEGAVGLFNDLRAVPDLHSPSCLRWREEDVIVPITLSLHYSRVLVSFSNAVSKTRGQFWLSLLLFAHTVRYALFSDDQGVYAVFAVSFGGRTKYLEVDGEANAQRILQFRKKLSDVAVTMRLTYQYKELDEVTLEEEVLRPRGLQVLEAQQRSVMVSLVTQFFGVSSSTAPSTATTTTEEGESGTTAAAAAAASNVMTVVEVEHEEEDLDEISRIRFAVPSVAA